MIEFFTSAIEHTFIQNALFACVLASIGCGLMGSFIVAKRMGFLVGGISHSVLSGMGIAYFYGQSTHLGAIIAAILFAVVIAIIKLRLKQNEDILIAAIWSLGMAIGLIFISKTPGYTVDLMHYLFGNILLVTEKDLITMFSLDLLLIICVFLFYKQLLITTFDEEFAKIRGVNTELFYTLLLCLISISIVLMIQVVGLIMVLALLVLPAATSALFARSFHQMILMAVVFCIVASLAGLILSYQPDLPSGAVIVMIAALIYFIALGYRQLKS